MEEQFEQKDHSHSWTAVDELLVRVNMDTVYVWCTVDGIVALMAVKWVFSSTVCPINKAREMSNMQNGQQCLVLNYVRAATCIMLRECRAQRNSHSSSPRALIG